MIIFLWVIIMIMVATMRVFQVHLGMPEMDSYFELIQKGTWIVIGIQYFIIGLAYIFHQYTKK